MDTVEKHLAALMAQSAPPRDAAFTLSVMTRIERQRFRREMTGNAAVAALAALILFALAPSLGAVFQGIAGNVIMALMVTGAALWAMQWSLQAMED